MRFKELSELEVADTLVICGGGRPSGTRCSNCKLFGNGDYKCSSHLMLRAAQIIENYIVREEIE